MSKSLENENDEVVTSLETAAHEAAMADGLIPTDGTDSKLKKAGLRRGKWTAEEESYANRLIYEFKLGLLPLTDGTTLRTFLSKLLNCDPMRISKKFVGQNCIGKQVFRRRQQDLEKLTPDQIETSRKELAELERKFLERVAQTNRTKTTGVKVVKDGRADDDNGSTSVAPWMVPPDDKSTGNDSSHRSSGPTPNPNSSSSYSNKEAPYNSNPSFPPNPATAANRMIGYGVGPDMLTVDYQHVISANNALMNQLYQGAQFPYMPNYPMPPPGYLRPDYHLGNGIPPPGVKPDPMGLHYPPPHPSYDPYYGMDALNRMHLPAPLLDANGQFRNDLAAAFPWSQQGPTPQPINPHDLLSNQNHSHNNNSNSSSSGNGNGNSSNSNSNNNNSHNNNSNSSTGHIDSISSNGLAHYPSGSEWNLQSLLGAGESMENIVQFLSQYQATSQSFENLQGAGAAALHNNAATTNNGSSIGNGIYVKKEGESSKDVMMSDHHLDKSDSVGHLSKKNPADDIGYPLDDGIVSTTNNSSVTPANSTPANGLGRSQKSSPPQKNDASSLATKSGDSKGKDEMNGYIIPSDTMASMAPMYQRNAANSFMAPAPPIAGQGMSDPVQAAFGVQPAPASGNLPRNSSIENFWMLVRMGDLPRPDQDVLSETIWEAHQQGGTTAKNGVAPNTAKPENPGKSSEISSNSAVKSAPSIPSSSLGLGRIKEEPGRPSYPQPPPAAGRIVPPIMVNTPTPNWPPAESRKRNEEAMSDRSSNSYGNPAGTKSSPPDGVNYAKKVKLEKE